MARYIAVVRKLHQDYHYSVDAPDIPGLAAEGNTIEIARLRFGEAVKEHQARARTRGDALPPPRPRSALTEAEMQGALDTYEFDPDRMP